MRKQQPDSRHTPKKTPYGLRVKHAVQQRLVLQAVRDTGVLGPGLRAAGVSHRVVQHWLASDPSFAGRHEEATLTFRDSIKDRLLDRAFSGDDSATLRFVARHLNPEEFGPPRIRRMAQAVEALRDPWTAWEQAHDQANLNN